MHDRITTTTARAKEMRALVEKIIRKGKQGGYQGNVFLKKVLYTNAAI